MKLIEETIMGVLLYNNVPALQAAELADEIADVCMEHFDNALQYYTTELNYWKQTAEDLEIDVLLEQHKWTCVGLSLVREMK